MARSNSGTGALAPHPIHHRFAQNLLSASHERDINEAALEWQLLKFDISEPVLHCHLCNTKINRYVVLNNTENKNELVIGEDCYQKLLQFLKDGQIKSVLPTREVYVTTLRDYWKKKMSELDETVVGWLREQLEEEKLPDNIAPLVYSVINLGFAPTIADADAVVNYYRTTRIFALELLIPRAELHWFRHKKLIPQQVTIDGAQRIRDLIPDDQRIQLKLQGKANRLLIANEYNRTRQSALSRIASARARLTEMCKEEEITSAHEYLLNCRITAKAEEHFPETAEPRDTSEIRKRSQLLTEAIENILSWPDRAYGAWMIAREELESALRWCRSLIAEAKRLKILSAITAEKNLEPLETFFDDSCPEEFIGTNSEIQTKVKAFEKLFDFWKWNNRWNVTPTSVVISVKKPDGNSVWVKSEEGFTRYPVAERLRKSGVESETWLYEAKVIIQDGKAAVLLLRRMMALDDAFQAINFTTPAEKTGLAMGAKKDTAPSGYIGFHNGHYVIPSQPLESPGRHLVYMRKQGKDRYQAMIL